MDSKPKWVGQSLRRKEDVQLLTGRGSFADDLKFPNLAHAAILRSPHAHARIRSIDRADARATDGEKDQELQYTAEYLGRSGMFLYWVSFWCLPAKLLAAIISGAAFVLFAFTVSLATNQPVGEGT